MPRPNDATNLPDSIETIVAHVDDLPDQRMVVELDGVERFTWVVSTAREGKEASRGTYGAYIGFAGSLFQSL